jgi:anti-sigma B factor antagonist
MALSDFMPEDPSKLAIVEEREGDVTVLGLYGEMLLDDGDLLLRQHVHDLVAKGQVRLIIDLSGVTHIDSSGIGMMVAKVSMVRKAGGDMKIVGLSSRYQRLLAIMKLVSIFETFDDVPSAVRSFSQ